MNVVEYGRRTRRRRRVQPMIYMLAVIFIIVAAFIWGSSRELDPDAQQGHDTQHEHNPPTARSGVQGEISALEWITPAFLPQNDFSRPGTPLTGVSSIVIHYIGNPRTTAEQNRNYFASLADSKEAYASSNFIVGMDGEILQCVPVDEVAFASNMRNEDSLSIECCHPDETGEFTKETYDSAIRLTAWLCNAYGLTADDVIRHYDVTGKECPRYYVLNEDKWEDFKADVAAAMEAD